MWMGYYSNRAVIKTDLKIIRFVEAIHEEALTNAEPLFLSSSAHAKAILDLK